MSPRRDAHDTPRVSAQLGPLARKVVAALAKLQRQNVIDLAAWRHGQAKAEAIKNTLISQPKLAALDPLHAWYVYGQHQLGAIIEQLAELPMLAKLTHAYAEAEQTYMPSGPPMSPLTTSYFTSWGAFDLGVGVKRESFASIALAVCRHVHTEPVLIELFETLTQSRMGVYRHEGSEGRYLWLTELITQRAVKAIAPSGYAGQPGELWLARVLPPTPRLAPHDYALVFTTPYLLGECDDRGRYRRALEADWLGYFARTLPQMKSRDEITAYERLMKYGLSCHYWNEYIFLAYVNHREDCVFLAGVPDSPRSLPHSKEGQARWDA
jgi:hypothetical protein